MKLRRIKPQAAPVPTDNPKPKSLRPSTASINRIQRSSEPMPQPIMVRIKKAVSLIGRKSRVLTEPAPQPVFRGAKSEIKIRPKAVRSRKRGTVENSVEEKAPQSPAPIVQSAAIHEAPGISPAEQPKPPAIPAPRVTRQPRPVPIKIPAILLEPDHIPGEEPVMTGPGTRFMATPNLEPAPSSPPLELPEAYGTQKIYLAPRDPYWLLASWDLDAKQRAGYNGQSASGALTVRLRRGQADGPIHLEVHAQPGSRDWFIYAGAPDTTFFGELGFHEKNSGVWRRISISNPITMPRDRAFAINAENQNLPELTPQLLQSARIDPEKNEEQSPSPAPQHKEMAFAIAEPQHEETRHRRDIRPGQGDAARPVLTPTEPSFWSQAQQKALEELISIEAWRTQHGSLEIEEVLRRHIGRPRNEANLPEAPSSLDLAPIEELLGLAQLSAPSSLEAAPLASGGKKFWFRVNAELIIYGSTEPNAHVSIGGRPIRLREDGTFSYRFALPDGAYELPAIAIAGDYSDARGAQLSFSRETQYLGHVAQHPQDPALKTPSAANI